MTFLLPLVSFHVAPFGSLLNTDTRSPTCTNQEINKKDEKLETKTKTDNEYQHLDVPGPKNSKTKRYGPRPFRCIVPFQYISANELNTFYSTLVDEVIAVIKTESNDLCSLNELII